VVFTSR